MRLEILILVVDDLPRAVMFYRAAFDWTVLVSAPVYVELDAHTVRVGLYDRVAFGKNIDAVPYAADVAAPSRTELYIRVEDLPAAIVRLTAAGARCLSPVRARPWGDDVAYFLDLDGNVIAIAGVAKERAQILRGP